MTEQLELQGIIDPKKENWQLDVWHDEFADNPRELNENLGQFCRHVYHDGCNEVSNDIVESLSWFDKKADKQKLDRMGYVAFPLIKFEHGDVHYYIGEPTCPWDSGQVGWYIVSKEHIRKWYGKRLTKKLLERIEHICQCELEEYTNWANGDVYGFTFYRNGEFVETCGGFYGDYDSDDNVKSMRSYFPKDFTDNFTVEETKKIMNFIQN